MKKGLTLIIIAAILTFVMSCSKSKTYTNYFSFKGTSYPVTLTSRASVGYGLTFASPDPDPSGTVTIIFPDSFPATVGNAFQASVATGDTLRPYPVLQLTIGGHSYYPTGHGATSIYYNLSSAGKFSFYTQSNSPIMMVSDTMGGFMDSGNLSINVNE
jgi:hypothetical protein